MSEPEKCDWPVFDCAHSAEFTRLRAQLATVTDELARLRAELARVTQELDALREKTEASNRKASEWLDAAFQRRDYAQDWLDCLMNESAPDAQWAANHAIVDGMQDRISVIHALFPDVPSDARAALEQEATHDQ